MTALPRRRRRPLVVDVAAALDLVGLLVVYLSPAFLVPAAVAVAYEERAWPFLAGAAAAVGTGLALRTATRAGARRNVGVREGYLVVAATWLLVAVLGAIPYLLSGSQLDRPVDALYESMSGFTTAGATVATDASALSHSLAVWRQLSVWLGGLGIVVLALAVLPRLRVGGRQLLAPDAGPDEGSLTDRVRDTARRFLALYLALTAFAVAVLLGVGLTGLDESLTPYDAVLHAIVTPATGGLSPNSRSVADYGAATHWCLILLMILGGTNFALLWRGLARRRVRVFARDPEFRLYLTLLTLGAALVAFELARASLYTGEAVARHAVFQAVSMMTTTGFASADFAQWTTTASVLLVALTFVGASAGSTSGSIKVLRHLVVGRMLARELTQTVHPQLIRPLRVGTRVLDDRTVRAVVVFVLLYIGVFALGALALALDASRTEGGLTPYGAIAASAGILSNTGPGIGPAGPLGTFAGFSDAGKGVMIALMWLGRLEIVPIVVLLTRSYWRN